jgi:hypothetical protein
MRGSTDAWWTTRPRFLYHHQHTTGDAGRESRGQEVVQGVGQTGANTVSPGSRRLVRPAHARDGGQRVRSLESSAEGQNQDRCRTDEQWARKRRQAAQTSVAGGTQAGHCSWWHHCLWCHPVRVVKAGYCAVCQKREVREARVNCGVASAGVENTVALVDHKVRSSRASWTCPS